MTCDRDPAHAHRHGPGCGHPAIGHGDHADYLHDGHLHAADGGHVDDHRLEVDRRHPASCAPVECGERHGSGCCHPAVPHGNHVDYLVNGTLHSPHGDHCDLHGPVPKP